MSDDFSIRWGAPTVIRDQYMNCISILGITANGPVTVVVGDDGASGVRINGDGPAGSTFAVARPDHARLEVRHWNGEPLCGRRCPRPGEFDEMVERAPEPTEAAYEAARNYARGWQDCAGYRLDAEIEHFAEAWACHAGAREPEDLTMSWHAWLTSGVIEGRPRAYVEREA